MDLTNINSCILYIIAGFQRIPSGAGLVCHSCAGKDMCRPLFPNFSGKCPTNRGGKCFVREDPNGGSASIYKAYTPNESGSKSEHVPWCLPFFIFSLVFYAFPRYECTLTLWEFPMFQAAQFSCSFWKKIGWKKADAPLFRNVPRLGKFWCPTGYHIICRILDSGDTVLELSRVLRQKWHRRATSTVSHLTSLLSSLEMFNPRFVMKFFDKPHSRRSIHFWLVHK